jgi:hypothetical protein
MRHNGLDASIPYDAVILVLRPMLSILTPLPGYYGETYQRLLASPGLFTAALSALTFDRWVIIDEVQRFIEEKRRRFVLCVSSVRKLKRRRQPTCRVGRASRYAPIRARGAGRALRS